MSAGTETDTLDDHDRSLLRLGRALQVSGYQFTTVSPATQARVNARIANSWARTARDVFGWSRPFHTGVLPQAWVELMREAGVLAEVGYECRSTVRASTLDGALFFHSAYPTSATDAVFFGPDTYRFCTSITAYLGSGIPVRRAVDIGCGAGPGVVTVALARPEAKMLGVDINDEALRFSRINGLMANATNVTLLRSNLLSEVEGEFDLIVANPPYLLDREERTYRHGGGGLGEGLSLAIVELAATRLAPGGTLLLYTGTAICGGIDRLRELATERLDAAGLSWNYRELDPDVFGEELMEPAYSQTERIAAVLLTAKRQMV